MPLLIGTDEAGYGPNLGPLVITATCWRIPQEAAAEQLWERLGAVVSDTPVRNSSRLYVADSKKVYSSGKSMAALERGVLAFLKLLNMDVDNVCQLGHSLSSTSFGQDYLLMRANLVPELCLPVENSETQIASDARMLAEATAACHVELLKVQSCIMFPQDFNNHVSRTNSKGQLLSAATLQLVRQASDEFDDGEGGWVVCDKHGGRNRYDDLISEAFNDKLTFRLEESGPRSRYKVGNLEFCFRTKAEDLLPVALASMVSKYVREVTMIQFNRFWQHHLPSLKPTKGYPQDALRFWSEIEPTVQKLGLDRNDIWRIR